MNPNDNNPFAASGASGAGTPSSPLSPLDFTNPDTLNTNTSSLSMSDSLASAQDSLTSAGQAAPSTSNAIGLDQLGLDKPSASMDTPNQPLTPAAPVPGSIGSVTSVPPVSTPDNLGNNLGSNLGSNATMPPVNTAPAAPSTTPVTTSNMPSLGGASSSSSASSNSGSARPYYNPFAQPASSTPAASPAPTPATPSTAPTSSTNVPPALQPQGEKFSDRLSKAQSASASKGSSKLLMIIGWVLALVFAATSVMFFIFWQNAQKAADEKEIIYVDRDPVEEKLSMLNCTQNLGADEGLGLEGLTWHSRDMSATFKNDALASLTLFNNFTFANAEAASNAEWYFNDLNTMYADMANNLGVDGLAISGELNDVVRTYNIGANADQLVGDFVGTYMLNTNEEGAVLGSREDVKQAYENAGFICTLE